MKIIIPVMLALMLSGCTGLAQVAQDAGEARDLTKARIAELVQDRRMVRDAYRSTVQDEISGLKAMASASMMNGDYEKAKTYWDMVYARLEQVYNDHLDIGEKFDRLLERFRDDE